MRKRLNSFGQINENTLPKVSWNGIPSGKITYQALDCEVTLHALDGNTHASEADINLFIETLCPEHFDKSRLNWFIPNPEWDWNQNTKELLNSINLILCRTHEVERIFTEL